GSAKSIVEQGPFVAIAMRLLPPAAECGIPAPLPPVREQLGSWYTSLPCEIHAKENSMTDSMRMTELDLLVGSIFTTRPEEDRELFEEEREWLSDIQDLLREEGVEVDLLSRPGVEIWEGGIEHFMDLYQLRLLAAYLEQGQD